MADLQLQLSINDLRGQALLQSIQRLKALDLTLILVYRIASLVDSATLAMAWQWDVLNPLLAAGLTQTQQIMVSSWDAITDIDSLANIDLLSEIEAGEASGSPSFDAATYRALILLSTALHSTIGTPAALKNALSNLGFPDAVILEGQNSWGGNEYSSDEGWAAFRVLINLAIDRAVDSAVPALLTAACNFWKPARCWLDKLQFIAAPLNDTLTPVPSDLLVNIFAQIDKLSPTPNDSIVAPMWPISDTKAIMPYCDGRYYCTGIYCGGAHAAVADSGVVVNGQAISPDY